MPEEEKEKDGEEALALLEREDKNHDRTGPEILRPNFIILI
jgi:hypothetical protein